MSSFDAPDDAVALDFAAPTKLLQTIDYLPALLSDPLLFARIATLHCLSDLYAMGATPHSALASVVVPFAADALMKSDLHQMLAGIMRELDAAGAALIGGHTAEGPVEAIGLTANGIAGQKLLTKGGLRPGDKLILTKPLGVGCLFAGAMQGRAKGYWIDRAIDGMLQSNGPAAAALEAAGSTGATDVTGFGLFGHLAEMLVASGVQASVELSRIPFYEGALELARRGVRSSLHRQNQGHVATWLSAVQNWDDPRVILAMDPQTSGGLVAGLRPELVSKCLKDLHQRGFAKACVIGEVTGHAAPGMAPLLLDEA